MLVVRSVLRGQRSLGTICVAGALCSPACTRADAPMMPSTSAVAGGSAGESGGAGTSVGGMSASAPNAGAPGASASGSGASSSGAAGAPTMTGSAAGATSTGGAGAGGGGAGGETSAPTDVDAGGIEPPSATLPAFDVYWDFESGDAEVPDDGGTYPITLEGATPETGPYGRFVSLSGQGSSGASAASPIDTSEDFSVSAWVRLDQLDDFDTFVGIDGAEVSAFYLQKRADDRWSFTTFPSDGTSASSCVATAEIQPRAGEWYHVVGTRSAATRQQRIYVDGVLSGKTTCTGGVFGATGGVSLGRGWYDGQAADWVQGAIDDVGLAQRVLEPGEVFDLYRAGRPDAATYLFAYFVEVSQGRGDGLRLAQSHDGLHWGAIGAGKVFMPPSVGGGSFRDPHLMRDPAGTYHLVWTTTCVPWAESGCVQDRGFGHASSPNLVDWSDATYVPIDLNVEHVWAPETFYDEASQQYMVFWSSPIDDNPSASDPHSIYYVLTQDFVSFSDPAVLYSQPGRNFIDATIAAQGDGYLMILKDEADGQKNLRALRSQTAVGSDAWTSAVSAPITGSYAAEGPSLLQRDETWYVYFDKYGEGAYGALQATSSGDLTQPAAWTDVSSSVFFPGVRHGTPIAVPPEVYRDVALVAGQ